MKLYKELNLTTDDGKLIGLIVLPDNMSLLVEGHAPTSDYIPGMSIASPEQKPKKVYRRTPKADQVSKYTGKPVKRLGPRGPLHKVPGSDGRGMRSLDADQIAKVRDCKTINQAVKVCAKFGRSHSTAWRIFFGKDAYAYLGERADGQTVENHE